MATQTVVALVLSVAGVGLLLGSLVHAWLLKSDCRPSPAFTPVTPQERAKAEDRGEAALGRFSMVGTWAGTALIVLGIVALVV